MIRWAIGACLILLFTIPALSDVPASLLISPGAILCIKMDDPGTVTGAFIIKSSGNENDDRAILAYAKTLTWAPKKPSDPVRNVWFPIGIAFGKNKPPRSPDRCAPPNS
jgi:TonB family protein